MKPKLPKLKKVKKKKLDITYGNLSQDEIMASLLEIKKKLKLLFKFHIGEEEATNPFDVFEEVIGISPLFLDIYKRGYWWNIIKKVIKSMRSTNELFIILKHNKLFVLSNMKEAEYYAKLIDTDIKNLRKAKKRAIEWVVKKRFRNF